MAGAKVRVVRFRHPDNGRIDDHNDLDAVARSHLTNPLSSQVLLHRPVRVAHDPKREILCRERAQSVHGLQDGLAPQIHARRNPQRTEGVESARLIRRHDTKCRDVSLKVPKSVVSSSRSKVDLGNATEVRSLEIRVLDLHAHVGECFGDEASTRNKEDPPDIEQNRSEGHWAIVPCGSDDDGSWASAIHDVWTTSPKGWSHASLMCRSNGGPGRYRACSRWLRWD